MKICHFSNSFIKITTADQVIICDPWVGPGNHGGWHSTPEYNTQDLITAVSDATVVYISHLHSDHFDPKFLTDSGLISKPFLIKKFQYPIMSNRLKNLGVNEIIEIESFDNHQLSANTNVTIVPQMTSNTAEEPDPVDFDLDTSIIVNSENTTFFNQVDNPLSISDLTEVTTYISQTYGKLDIACFTCGAASEYPQCFVNIDRNAEKERIIRSSLNKLNKSLSLMKPTYFFLAGGAYFIPGRFFELNKYIAQPSLDEVETAISENTTMLKPSGGQLIQVASNVIKICNHVEPQVGDVQTSIQNHKNDAYHYETLELPDQLEIQQNFKLAQYNYAEKTKQLEIELMRMIIFKIHNTLLFDDDINIKSKAVYNMVVNPNYDGEEILNIHIEEKAFWGCLNKKLIWNQVLSGSLCAYERVPNIYEPEALFSLNYLVK
jgi:UDP-MurNAc hydroxylase